MTKSGVLLHLLTRFTANITQMAKEKIVLDKRRQKDDGTYPVKLYVWNKREILISTNFYATEENFKEGSYTKKEPDARAKNAALRNMLSTTVNEMILLESSGQLKRMEDKALKKHLVSILFHKDDKKEEERNFISYLDEFTSLKSNQGTISCYTTTRNKLLEFDPDCTFETIDRKWLASFEKWMSQTLKTNSYAIHLRNIRAVFNYAIDEEITTLYPFRKYRIKKEETRKRSLSVEQLRTLLRYDCDEYQKKYRDLFMLDFYLIGMNIGNLLLLKDENLSNGQIEYYRNKTNKLISIQVVPEAIEIIEKYKGKNYLLNVMDEYTDYRYFVKRMNTALKQIGETTRSGLGGKKSRKPLFPGLSSYWARHTWATLAAELDIPKETISAALSHSTNDTTSIYIRFNRKKIDEANRKVIDYVLGNME